MKVVKKVLGMLASATLLCAGNLCINASKEHGKIPYVSVTVTFLIEVLKLVLCLIAITVWKVPAPTKLTLKESAYYAVPSLLYMIDNNLTYVILRYIDPATLSVLWNLKIITTAVLFRVVLKRRISEIRRIAIALLLLGVVTSQSDQLQKKNHHADAPPPSTSSTTTTNPQDYMLAMFLLLTAVTISSCASVFTEWAFKRKDSSCAFLWQNALLYIFGILFNGIGVLVEGNEVSTRGFLDGYNGWTVAVIFVNCIAGISMGFILKFLDNIACVYAHAVAMMLTMLFSMVFFRFSPSLEFVCGLSVLLISMYLYHHKIDGSHAPGASPGHCHSHSHADTPSTSPTTSCSSPSPSKLKPDAASSSAVLSRSSVGLHSNTKLYKKVPDSAHEIELGRSANQ